VRAHRSRRRVDRALSPEAIAWDAAFADAHDRSDRALAGVHPAPLG